MLFGNKHFTQVGDATLFFYLSTSRILTFAGERSDHTNVKIRLVDGQSPVEVNMEVCDGLRSGLLNIKRASEGEGRLCTNSLIGIAVHKNMGYVGVVIFGTAAVVNAIATSTFQMLGILFVVLTLLCREWAVMATNIQNLAFRNEIGVVVVADTQNLNLGNEIGVAPPPPRSVDEFTEDLFNFPNGQPMVAWSPDLFRNHASRTLGHKSAI